uniref:ribosomal protein S10 n=1 Tax=Thalassionema bacillare TaxID=426664 RepID=UPI001EE0870F|nr:ribosomal protein S10 [Thalassionema bacillare]UHY40426.1 ribosomal protein S10 [Thalassionema bacillare]UHY40813.1 ribosomal protein S10 [Thalassionema bacillare]UHY41071.1 ribosomal protein S10 [Thalassionema bacillare]
MTFELTEQGHTKVRVKLWGYKSDDLIAASLTVIETIHKAGYNPAKQNTVQLPNRKRIYCILRSPHVDKDSREHFEIRKHSRFVEVSYNLEEYPHMIETLMNLDLSAGVSSILFVDPNTK